MKNFMKNVFISAITFLVLFGGAGPLLTSVNAETLPPEKGNLYIHKYYMEDTSEAGPSNNGEEATPPASAVPIGGVDFDIYKVSAINGRYPEGKSVVVEGNKLIDEGLSYAIQKVVTVTSQADGQAFASELNQGVYVVVEKPLASITIDGKEVSLNPIEPFVVHVPMTNPNGNGWLTDVHVYPKNEGLVVEKKGETSLSNQIGDTMTYRIDSKVPAGVYDEDAVIDGKINYKIIDTLDGALTFKQESLKVYLTESKDVQVADDKRLAEGLDYTINPGFSVVFTREGRKKLSGSKFVAIVFEAIVNKGILAKQDLKVVGNKATVDFTNKNGEDLTKETPSVDIHTGTIVIKKMSARDGSVLTGAKFQIATSEENAKKGLFLKKDVNGHVITNGSEGFETAVAWVETTGNDGLASFSGLKEYDSTMKDEQETITSYRSYWLVEVEAPAGYHLLDQPVQVSFNEKSSTGDNPTYTVSSEIKNSKKGLLPKTGSLATILLSVLGIVVIGGAVIVNIFSNKKKGSV